MNNRAILATFITLCISTRWTPRKKISTAHQQLQIPSLGTKMIVRLLPPFNDCLLWTSFIAAQRRILKEFMDTYSLLSSSFVVAVS
jgi:hypothetical protein